MPGLRCGASLCQFVSEEGTMDQKLQHLSLHAQTAHPVQQQQGNGAARGKVDRPTLHTDIDQEGWSFFNYDWEN